MDARRILLLNINILACSNAEKWEHAKKCKPLLHCSESLKRNNIEIVGS